MLFSESKVVLGAYKVVTQLLFWMYTLLGVLLATTAVIFVTSARNSTIRATNCGKVIGKRDSNLRK